jgi:hypothetical protein
MVILMKESTTAYSAQIEAAGLPVTGVEDNDDWATIRFTHEFQQVELVSPQSDPSCCRLLLGYTVDSGFKSRELDALKHAGLNNEYMKVAKTFIRFRENDALLQFACDFFTDGDYAIRPSLRCYLDLLSQASREFDQRFHQSLQA